jgi:hypothetical protein
MGTYPQAYLSECAAHAKLTQDFPKDMVSTEPHHLKGYTRAAIQTTLFIPHIVNCPKALSEGRHNATGHTLIKWWKVKGHSCQKAPPTIVQHSCVFPVAILNHDCIQCFKYACTTDHWCVLTASTIQTQSLASMCLANILNHKLMIVEQARPFDQRKAFKGGMPLLLSETDDHLYLSSKLTLLISLIDDLLISAQPP